MAAWRHVICIGGDEMRFACYEYCASAPDTDLVGMHLISTCSSYIHTHTQTLTQTRTNTCAGRFAANGPTAHALCHGWSPQFTSTCASARAQSRKAATMRRPEGETLCCITYLAHVLHGDQWRDLSMHVHCDGPAGAGAPLTAPLCGVS